MTEDYAALKGEMLEIAKILEAFPPAVQPQVFDILTSKYLGNGAVKKTEKGGTSDEAPDPDDSATKKRQTGAKRAASRSSGARRQTGGEISVGVLKDLNLRGAGGKKSFKDFFDEKKPSSNIDFNAVSVYYLARIMEISPITPSHVNTCYKEVVRRPPGSERSFLQSLRDTASDRYGYIDVTDMNDIKLPFRGESYVEHDLPKAATRVKAE